RLQQILHRLITLERNRDGVVRIRQRERAGQHHGGDRSKQHLLDSRHRHALLSSQCDRKKSAEARRKCDDPQRVLRRELSIAESMRIETDLSHFEVSRSDDALARALIISAAATRSEDRSERRPEAPAAAIAGAMRAPSDAMARLAQR